MQTLHLKTLGLNALVLSCAPVTSPINWEKGNMTYFLRFCEN